MLRTLAIWAVPAVILSLLGGGWLSHRALRRVGVMHRAIDRIMHGDLHERIPTLGDYDEMERMAGRVNRMLERIEFPVEESEPPLWPGSTVRIKAGICQAAGLV